MVKVGAVPPALRARAPTPSALEPERKKAVSVQAVDPAAAAEPDAQARQTADEVAPVVLDAVPAAHSVQLVAPPAAAYVPTGQLEQAEDDAEVAKLPGAQGVQVLTDDAPTADENVPAVQVEQAPAPPAE